MTSFPFHSHSHNHRLRPSLNFRDSFIPVSIPVLFPLVIKAVCTDRTTNVHFCSLWKSEYELTIIQSYVNVKCS